MPAPSRLQTLLLACALLSAAPDLSAQCAACADYEPRWQGEALSLAVNSLLAGATAGVHLRLRGGDFVEGFLKGAAGGTLTYAGKRIAVERFTGAGLLGREVAAVGSSVARNAADGEGVLSRLMLPVGPFHLYVTPRGAGRLIRARVDLPALLAAGYLAAHSDTRFDLEESLSSGALLFRREGLASQVGFEGAQFAGVIQIREDPGGMGEPYPEIEEQRERTTAHERVHVLQYDQGFLLWAAPAEELLMRQAAWSRRIQSYVDLGLHLPLLTGLNALLPYDARPTEIEAYFLSRTRTASTLGSIAGDH